MLASWSREIMLSSDRCGWLVGWSSVQNFLRSQKFPAIQFKMFDVKNIHTPFSRLHRERQLLLELQKQPTEEQEARLARRTEQDRARTTKTMLARRRKQDRRRTAERHEAVCLPE